MKYINHMTSSGDDEKHMALMEKAGLEGYAVYWLVAEKIAAQIRPECISTSLSLSWRSWGLLLRIDPRKARRLIRSIGEAKLCRIEVAGDVATVDMPNLLKYADEWTKRVLKNSGVTPEKLPSNSGVPALQALPARSKHMCDSSANADGDRDFPARKRIRKTVPYTPEFIEFWDVYPRRLGKQDAFQKWQAVVREEYPVAHLLAAAKEYSEQCVRQKTEERFIKHPSTFLGKGRWKDYVFVEDAGVPDDIATVPRVGI